MLLSDFDYGLPAELIAQEPAAERSQSRLFVIERTTGRFSHHRFADIVELLPPDCLLVLNDTKVFPARLHGQKESGGRIEILLVRRLPGDEERWAVLCKGGQNLRAGSRLQFSSELSAVWCTTPRDGRGVLQFFSQQNFAAVLERIGEIPLPPYIKRTTGTKLADKERYQTVYARHSGAIAAPTAGLHFTPELLALLQQRGIETAFVTLHVGAGTFQPVRDETVEAHRMEEESFILPLTVAEKITRARQQQRKVVAVGTTTTRALESAGREAGQVHAGCGTTDLFIYPGFPFQVIDGLITNFHLPRSTLLLLVAAFAGRELTLQAYAEAVTKRYRFYSYGDAMLIL
jgi:S-adenosylmethionine:tRNA ribosyltransferase-isomerase